MPKAVIAVVPGWAVGGGHSLHVVCDLTLASKEHAIFKQTDADVTSFDGGYGSAYLAKMVGQKKDRGNTPQCFLLKHHNKRRAHKCTMGCSTKKTSQKQTGHNSGLSKRNRTTFKKHTGQIHL